MNKWIRRIFAGSFAREQLATVFAPFVPIDKREQNLSLFLVP